MAARRAPLRSSLVLGAFPTAVPCARLHTRQVLWEWMLPVDVDSAELLVSELVTNGVQAAGAVDGKPPVGLYLSAGDALVLIEVWDGSTQPPVPAELQDGIPALDQEGGRGLFLVEALSERWGWWLTKDPPGKVTWSEVSADLRAMRRSDSDQSAWAAGTSSGTGWGDGDGAGAGCGRSTAAATPAAVTTRPQAIHRARW